MTIAQKDDSRAFQAVLPVPETRAKNKSKLPSGFVPSRYTVLCGRGKVCSASPGNKYLRSLVDTNLVPYSRAQNKIEKSTIVSSIVDAVRKHAPVGAFVKQDQNGDWLEVDDSFAREKIGCIFRDLLHTQYRSSTKAKFALKKALKNREFGHHSWKKNQLNTSYHSEASDDNYQAIDACRQSGGQELIDKRNGRSPALRQTDPFHLELFSMDKHCLEQDQRKQDHHGMHYRTSPYGWTSAGLPDKNLHRNSFSTQPRGDILADSGVGSLQCNWFHGKSSSALLKNACGIMGLKTELDDFPDDLSDIFDDDKC